MKAEPIISAVQSVTKRWAKQRKAEERRTRRAANRRWLLDETIRVPLKEAVALKMEAAYMKASDDNANPATARQIYYCVRAAIQSLTSEPLDDKYFTQRLLPDYLRDNPDKTAHWDVVMDARGHFVEPHTAKSIELGTLAVRDYLAATPGDEIELGPSLFPTSGPLHRFGAILYVEKEGFLPLFEHVDLAKRFDVAIASTKGMSVVAFRQLIDSLCSEHDIPLLVLHDFDKSGFSILGTLRRSNDRYRFRNQINVIDLGLRLEDVRELGLEAEDVTLSGDKRPIAVNLARNGASQSEIDFLLRGKRVELNAMTSGQLVQWIESKLDEHGIKKVVPPTSVLEQWYRENLKQNYIEERLKEVKESAQAFAESAAVPKGLRKQVIAALGRDQSAPWDRAIQDLAAANGNSSVKEARPSNSPERIPNGRRQPRCGRRQRHGRG